MLMVTFKQSTFNYSSDQAVTRPPIKKPNYLREAPFPHLSQTVSQDDCIDDSVNDSIPETQARNVLKIFQERHWQQDGATHHHVGPERVSSEQDFALLNQQ